MMVVGVKNLYYLFVGMLYLGLRACAVPGAAGGAGARAAPRRHYTIARAARAGGGRRRRRDAGPRSCRSGTKRGRPAPPEPPEPGRSPRPPRLT